MSAKRWTTDDEQKMIDMYKNGNTYTEIANKLNRTSSAIKLRIESIVYNNITKGKDIHDLAKKLNKTSNDIIQMYIVHKNFKMSKGEDVADVNVVKHFEFNGNKSKSEIDRIGKENDLLEIILKNYELKLKVAKLIADKKLDKSVVKLLNL